MARKCDFSGKKSMVGNRVSHAKNRTKVRLFPNLQSKRLWVPSKKSFIKVKVSNDALRTINKIGIEAYAARVGLTL